MSAGAPGRRSSRGAARQLRWYLDIIWTITRMRVKHTTLSPLDFAIGLVSTVAMMTFQVATVWIVMRHVREVAGWNYHEILFMFGVFSTARSLNQMFSPNLASLWRLYVRTGDFDQLLVSPASELFLLAVRTVSGQELGATIAGTVILVHASLELGVAWDPLLVVYCVGAVVAAALVITAIQIMVASLSFLYIDPQPAMKLTGDVMSFGYYPMTIYGAGLRQFLTWVIPLGFLAYYPASYILGKEAGFLTWAGFPLAALEFALAVKIWNLAVRQYSSTGS